MFDLPFDPWDLGTIQMRKVPCEVCAAEFWVPDRHPGPYTCQQECAEERLRKLNVSEAPIPTVVPEADNG